MKKSEKLEVFPVFDENAVVIGVSVSNIYMPYFCVYLQSIIENASPETNYDIIVLGNIEEESQYYLQEMLNDSLSLSLRFVDPECLFTDYHIDISHPRLTKEIYYKFMFPRILKNYRKVLWTDIDLIFKEDPAELFATQLDEYPLACCQSLYISAILNTSTDYYDYITQTLELTEPYQYVNTGVLLINIPQWGDSSEKILQDPNLTTYRIYDQDAINKFFKHNILYLPPQWNTQPISVSRYHMIPFMSSEAISKYEESMDSPKIIHWSGGDKPWNRAKVHKGYEWWRLARKTPFYEEIIYTNTISQQTHNHQEVHNHYHQVSMKFLIKKVLKKIVRPQWLRDLLKKVYHRCKNIFRNR
ncbi:MAG: glycosyltransferase family 8 protein [Brevinema sp.]